MNERNNRLPVGLILKVAGLLVFLLLVKLCIGVNSSGQRTVIEYPNGALYVKFTPGVYAQLLGKETVYADILTFDFDDSDAEEKSALDQMGINVRYQDGGTGTIYGKARYELPNDEQSMLAIHKAFRTSNGVAQKLIKSQTEGGMNLTAGLMTSEEAYTEKRGTFKEWSREQIGNGTFITEGKEIVVTGTDGQTTIKNIPVIKMDESGRPMQSQSDLAKYGIRITGFDITDWDFEGKTLDQIAAKREATMAIITAKARAEQANQESLTAEAQGKQKVMEAQYEEEVTKKRAVVEAEQAKEVAILKAQQQKEEAEIAKETALIKLETAKTEAEAVIETAKAEAEAKRLIVEADGALEAKLRTEENINKMWADAYAKRAVPSTVFGGGGESGVPVGADSEATNFMRLLTMDAAQRLSYDRTVRAGEGRQETIASTNNWEEKHHTQ